MLRHITLLFSLTVGTMTQAETPIVVTDIAPVHSLVSRVMQGVGTPDLIIPQTSSPHGYAMRPSQAAALQDARLVVWMGPGLSPWLEDPLATLAPDAQHMNLMEAHGTHILPWREGASFDVEGHDDEDHADEGHEDEGHDHEDHADEGHDHEGHDDEDHADEAHDDHGHDEEDHAEEAHAEEGHDDDHGHDHGHDHDGPDPHAWLDPQNAALWLGEIAVALGALDPENAAIYLANATTGQAELARLSEEISAQLSTLDDPRFVVSHDALHYFEARFDVHARGAVADGDAAAPGAARLSNLKKVMQDQAITCIMVEPGTNTDRLGAIFDSQMHFGEIDLLGQRQTLGVTLYPGLLRAIAQNISACAVH
ncbi:MAG: zinc ABC transporter substrate-binding protein [Roseovarius sp.]|nr:zinc ABC transporter substrate-binding protein [Roseovarius sp.]